MKNFFLCVIACSVAISCLVVAQNFVVKKNNKTRQVSSSAMKEECSDLLVEGFEITTNILHKVATLQHGAMCILTSMVEGSFLSSAKKTDIAISCQGFEAFYQRQQQIEVLLDQQIDFIMNVGKISALNQKEVGTLQQKDVEN